MIEPNLEQHRAKSWLDEETPPKYTDSHVAMVFLAPLSVLILDVAKLIVTQSGGRAFIGWTPRSTFDFVIFSVVVLVLPLGFTLYRALGKPKVGYTRWPLLFAFMFVVLGTIWGIGFEDYMQHESKTGHYRVRKLGR